MPERSQELEQWLASTVTSLAREDPITLPSVQLWLQHKPSAWTMKQYVRTLLRLAAAYRQQGRLGRLRAVLLLGATMLGVDFVKKCERTGVLLAHDSPSLKFRLFLEHLEAEARSGTDESWPFLAARIRTYLAYEQLVHTTSVDQQNTMKLLRESPREIIKKVMVLTHLRFLSYMGEGPPAEISEWLEEFGTPEDFGSIASLLIAVANGYRPIDSIDFAFPLTADIVDSEVRTLMEYGRAVHQRYELSKDISLFGYSLELTESTGRVPILYLRPPSSEFERAVRLGYIRTDMGRPGTYRAVADDLRKRPLSILGAAEVFASRFRDKICELKHEPNSRVRVKFPMAAELYKSVLEGGYYEDFAEQEELSTDFLAPVRGKKEAEIQLTQHLDLRAFLSIWRLLRFFAFVDIYCVRSFGEDLDLAARNNSVFRVAKEKEFIELLSSIGFRDEQIQEFLRLVSADMKQLKHFDLQYRPFLRIAQSTIGDHTSPPEIVYVPALVGFSNALRNVQSANQVRLPQNAELFVEVVAEVLGRSFSRITVNRRVKSRNEETGITENTDIDVVLLEGKRLYLFECKHSLPPTGPHEMRDLWEDVEKGAQQLHTAQTLLSDATRLHNYLTGWFPGLTRVDTVDIRVATCVICSHRIFAGMTHAGVPIRDFSSLARLTGNGVVGLGTFQNDESMLHRFRVTETEKFSPDDLDDYLSPDPKFFKTFTHFMYPVSRLIRCRGATIARETFVYEVDNIEWIAYMNSLGFARLEDERKKWVKPWAGDELMAKLKSLGSNGDEESPST